MLPTHYSVLGVSETASQDEIRSAYRWLVRRHHPDVSHAPNAEEIIKTINVAYDILGDPARRRNYDRALQAVRDEQARIAYVERMRSAPPPPPPRATTEPPHRPNVASPPIPTRPPGMRSGRVVLATVIMVIVAMIGSTQFDVPAKEDDGFKQIHRLPPAWPTETMAPASSFLPPRAPTVEPFYGPLQTSIAGQNADPLTPSLTALQRLATASANLHYYTPTP